MNYWKFQKTGSIINSRFDQLLKKFYEHGISGLVRENIQNSCDARLDNSSEPVIVKIETGEINKFDIPGFDELLERVKVLRPTNPYSEEEIGEMISHLNDESFHFITFEDINTKGLSGSEKGQKDHDGSPYSAYAYTKGVHYQDEDLDIEKQRGGSHGVGKIASNAASIFNTMFFANCDEFGNRTLGGVAELMEHKYEDKYYRATGFFTKEDENGLYYPFENEDYHRIFRKKERGLKVIIPFLRSKYRNEKEIFRTVCDSFLLAILEGNLVVHVNDKILDQDSIKSYVTSDEYFEQTIENIKEYFTPLYLETYKHLTPVDLQVADKYGDEYYYFNLYFYLNPNITNGRTAIIRSIGMKIEDHKVPSFVKKPYCAIITPKSSNEDQFLKSLENESHTKIGSDHIHSEKAIENAEYFIRKLDNELKKYIEKEIENATKDSEIMDTADVIFINDNKFEKQLKKARALVNIGTGNGKKTIVKVKDTPKAGKSPKFKKRNSNRSKWARPVRKEFGDQGKKEYYQLKGGIIKRLYKENKEILHINISKIPFFQGIKKGNILISLIDGMGKEHYNEFDLTKEYKIVEDLNSYEKLAYNEYCINGVDLSTGVIKISIRVSSKYNRYSKLRYYIEV